MHVPFKVETAKRDKQDRGSKIKSFLCPVPCVSWRILRDKGSKIKWTHHLACLICRCIWVCSQSIYVSYIMMPVLHSISINNDLVTLSYRCICQSGCTRPNHLGAFTLNLSSIGATLTMSQIVSFIILYFVFLPHIHLTILILGINVLFHSCPRFYRMTHTRAQTLQFYEFLFQLVSINCMIGTANVLKITRR